MTARSQVVLVALLASVLYAIACFLPGEPSGARRVTFELDFAQPYRVPLAGAAHPAVKITADGQVLSGPNYHLESLDPVVVHVDPTGRGLEGVARGTASVRMVYETATGAPDTTFAVRVVVSRVAANSASLAFTRLADTSRLTATAYDATDAAVPSVKFSWSSAETHVASVDTAGLVRALNEGTVAITAEADSVKGSSSVSVTQVAAAVRMVPKLDTLRTVSRLTQFLAVALDDTNGVIRTAKPHWSSSNEGVARVDTTGRATATGAGTAKIIARVGAAADTAIIVVAQVVRFITVKPSFDTLTAIADTVRHTALAFDSLNFPIPKPTVVWAMGDTTVATVDQAGLVRAAKNGVVLVTASAAGQSAFATVVVHQGVAAAQISPNNITLAGAGDTARLSAVGLDRNGYPVPGAGFTWRSGSECVATVNAGLVTALGGGVTGVIAIPLNGRRADTAAVTVTGAPTSQPQIAFSGAGIEAVCSDGSGRVVLLPWSGASGLSWSPDGARLVVAAGCGIITTRPDGSDQQVVTPNPVDCTDGAANPAWSPDGTKIAWQGFDYDGYSYINVVNTDGSNVKRLVSWDGSFNSVGPGAPTWSPDGTKLAFLINRGGGVYPDATIYVTNADGTNATQLWSSPGIDGSQAAYSGAYPMGPAWSPDGSQLAVIFKGDIWLVNADGSGATNLHSSAGLNVPDAGVNAATPAWSPDGTRLVFSMSAEATLGLSFTIWVINRDGTGRQRLTSMPPYIQNLHPSWRPMTPPLGPAALRTPRTGSH